MSTRETEDDIDRQIEASVIVYGPPGQAVAYSTACTWYEMVLQCGYCRRRHPGADVRAEPADAFHAGRGQ